MNISVTYKTVYVIIRNLSMSFKLYLINLASRAVFTTLFS